MSLCRREIVRFLRQRHRIVGALATPIVFWIAIGAGMGRSFQAATPDGGGFMQYFFPGTVVMILLFTAIFSTISVIEDRREGFLQSVLVAPVSRMAIVLGKTLGGTILAAGQGLLFLLAAPLIGVKFTPVSFLAAILMILIISFALTALGFCIAWRMSSTQGFHAIMNLFLLPMWFLSGAMFPADKAAKIVRWMMDINPLTYGVLGLRQTLYWNNPVPSSAVSWPICLAISIGFAAVMFALASWIAQKNLAADLQ
jgi:ABC-2 type transport system permease protein